MPLGIKLDLLQFDAVVEAELTEAKFRIGRAAQLGLREARDVLRDGIEPALGRRVAQAWKRQLYPANGESLDVAGVLISRAPDIHESFGRGSLIRSTQGRFLAIPTPEAGKMGTSPEGGKARLTPGSWERRHGVRLRFVYRKTGPSLLVADGRRLGRQGQSKARGARLVKGGVRATSLAGIFTTIMFILVPQVRMRQKFDLDALHVDAAEKFRARIQAVTG